MRIDLLLSPRRLTSLAAVAVGAALTLSGLTGLLGPDSEEPPPGSAPTSAAPAPRVQQAAAGDELRHALRVLNGWDRARSAAYEAGDSRRLGGLYTPRSPARAADLALLAGYAGQGIRVRDLRMQLLSLEVLEAAPRRLRLRVTDRVHGATAVGPQGGVRLRPDPPSTRVVVLVRAEPRGTWRVSAVRGR